MHSSDGWMYRNYKRRTDRIRIEAKRFPDRRDVYKRQLSRDTATFTFIPSILLYLRLLPGTDERYSIEDVGHHE